LANGFASPSAGALTQSAVFQAWFGKKTANQTASIDADSCHNFWGRGLSSTGGLATDPNSVTLATVGNADRADAILSAAWRNVSWRANMEARGPSSFDSLGGSLTSAVFRAPQGRSPLFRLFFGLLAILVPAFAAITPMSSGGAPPPVHPAQDGLDLLQFPNQRRFPPLQRNPRLRRMGELELLYLFQIGVGEARSQPLQIEFALRHVSLRSPDFILPPGQPARM